MSLNEESIRLILGLKIRQTRLDKKVSLTALSEQTGISISYLNEIEKGKKNPKPVKIAAIAEYLDVSYDWLVSLKLENNLSPFTGLIKDNELQKMPFSFFGVDNSKLLELFNSEPSKIAALVNAIQSMGDSFGVSKSDFLNYGLKSYRELHNHYFAHLEEIAIKFKEDNKVSISHSPSENELRSYISNKGISKLEKLKFGEALSQEESLSFRHQRNQYLFLNDLIRTPQRNLAYSREISADLLLGNGPERNIDPLEMDNFKDVISDFHIEYLSSCILIKEEQIKALFHGVFSSDQWKPWFLEEFMIQNHISSETLVFRFISLAEKLFNLNQLYFFKMVYHQKEDELNIIEELKFNLDKNAPIRRAGEYYCRRWKAYSQSKELSLEAKRRDISSEVMIDAQILNFHDSDVEYLVITFSEAFNLNKNIIKSNVLGIRLSDKQKKIVNFINDPKIKTLDSGNSCERCGEHNCKERVTPAKEIIKQQSALKRKQAFEEMLDNYIK